MVARERQADAHDARVGQAWLTARLVAYAFHEPRKMPSLDKLLTKRGEKQTPLQGLQVMKTLAAQWGGKLRKTRLRRVPMPPLTKDFHVADSARQTKNPQV